MKAIRKWLGFLALAAILSSIFAGCAQPGSLKNSIEIAFVGQDPLIDGRPNPNSPYAGIYAAAEEVNKSGGLDGKPLIVIPYDDNNDPETARQIAETISQSRALAVIGHTASEASDAAATIYDREYIPAIVPVPDAENLLQKHPLLFGAAYSTETESGYLANYLKKIAGEDTVSIIYADTAAYRAAAVKLHNTFHGLGGNINYEKSIPAEASQDAALESIVSGLTALNAGGKKLGAIFIAADPSLTARLVVMIRRKGITAPIAGTDNIGDPAFMDYLNSQSEERALPGYFSDGILFTRPILTDSASNEAARYLNAFQEKYRREAAQASVFGYDAALALVNAIRSSSVEAASQLDARRQIYDALLSMRDGDHAVNALTGPLYFQNSREASIPIQIGIFQNGRAISALTQFVPIENPDLIADFKEQLADGRIITVDGRYVYVVHVVYTGVDIIEIRDIDIKNSTYNMDFYLWFRYSPNDNDPAFNPDRYVFTNQAEAPEITLISKEKTSDREIRETYRVTGVFKNQFVFQDYPFDRQTLLIQFRNLDAATSIIKYVVDRVGMRYGTDQELFDYLQQNGAFRSLYGWKPVRVHAEQDVFTTTSTLGNPLNFERNKTSDYSLYRIELDIQRDSLDYIIKNLLPLLITLLLAYITFYLPLGHSERLGVGSTALLTTAFFHLNLASALPEIGYTVAMEYFFYASYGMSALIVFLETISIRLEKRGEEEKNKKKKADIARKRDHLNLAGRIIYPAILAGVLLAGALLYKGVFILQAENGGSGTTPIISLLAKTEDKKTGNASQQVSSTPADSSVELRLGSWRPEDAAQIQPLLDAFQAYAARELGKNITVKYEPVKSVNYDTILKIQFEDGNAPDALYVRPGKWDDNIVAQLQPLEAAQIENKYSVNARAAWQSGVHRYHALPFVGVVQAVYYNVDVFNSLGLSTPRTWDEFISISQALKNAGYIPIGNSLNQAEDSEMFMSLMPNFVDGSGGRAEYSLPNNARCFNDRRVTRAFQAIEEIEPYLPPNAAFMTSSESKELFINQKAAMLFGGSWDTQYFTNTLGFQWSVFAPPAPAGSKTYVIFQPDIGIGVNKNSRHPGETMAFIEWLASARAVSLTTKYLPGFYPLINDRPQNDENTHNKEFLDLANRHPTDVRWVYDEISDHYPQASAIVREALYEMALNRLTAQGASQRLQDGLAEWYAPAQNCK